MVDDIFRIGHNMHMENTIVKLYNLISVLLLEPSPHPQPVPGLSTRT